MSNTEPTKTSNPEARNWIRDNLPHKTVAGIEMAYLDIGRGHSTQFHSIDWLTEEFGEIISTVKHPKQDMLDKDATSDSMNLKRLFSQLDDQ